MAHVSFLDLYGEWREILNAWSLYFVERWKDMFVESWKGMIMER
jgi:hypothetical protein